MRIFTLVGLALLATLSFVTNAVVAVVAAIVPDFASPALHPLSSTPRSIFETRRAGLA